MNVDIETEHVRMQPAWHRMIDDWLARARRHQEVAGVDIVLRHADRPSAEEVAVVATARGRKVAAVRHADMMAVALREALDAVELDLDLGSRR